MSLLNSLKGDVWKYIILPLFIILFMIFLLNEIIMPLYTRHGQQIDVPDVVEMTYEGARTLLEQHDLKIVEKVKQFDAKYRAGTVMSQDPVAHSKVKKGRRIYVIVSKGEPIVEMPRLIGLSEKNAIFEISKSRLKLRNLEYEHSEHFPGGVVVSQSISEGTEMKSGDEIDINVSLGRFPDRFIVPYLVGRSLTDAKKALQQSGLALGSVGYEVQNELLPETVVLQSVEPNTEVPQGSSIDLVVSRLESTD